MVDYNQSSKDFVQVASGALVWVAMSKIYLKIKATRTSEPKLLTHKEKYVSHGRQRRGGWILVMHSIILALNL